MLQLWNYISSIGLDAQADENLQKRIVLSNRTNLLAAIVFLVTGLLYYSFEDYRTAYFVESLILFNVLAYYFQYKRQYIWSLSVFLFASYLSIFYFDSYAGISAGAALYFIPIVLSLFFLFDLKTKRKLIFAHICVIVVLYLINFFTHNNLFKSAILTEAMKSNLLIANVIFSLIATAYFLYVLEKQKQT